MIIKNKTVIVYDIEVFPNCIHITTKNTEDQTYHKFEISTRRNDINNLYEYFKTKSFIFVGYNNHHYDDIIINYILFYLTLSILSITSLHSLQSATFIQS